LAGGGGGSILVSGLDSLDEIEEALFSGKD
jgi:hypothetical protein